MIDHVRGDLVRREQEAIVVRCNGIGFRLEIPTGAYAEVPEGEQVEVPTTLILRQDGVSLYGFSTATEREFFALLTSITGIGPKSALGILGNSSPSELAEAIMNEDVSALVGVKGIGKKSAQRILVELPEKIRALRPGAAIKPGKKSNQAGLFGEAAKNEALEVLLSLGCTRSEAEAALDAVADRLQPGEEDADLLVMHALKALGGR